MVYYSIVLWYICDLLKAHLVAKRTTLNFLVVCCSAAVLAATVSASLLPTVSWLVLRTDYRVYLVSWLLSGFKRLSAVPILGLVRD